MVVYHRSPYEVLEFDSNNLNTMALSTKGAARESPGQRPGSVRRQDATLPDSLLALVVCPRAATKARRDGKS